MDQDVFHNEEGEVLDLEVQQGAPVKLDDGLDLDLEGRQHAMLPDRFR